jgi:serine/threonine protein phosphatase PrpC
LELARRLRHATLEANRFIYMAARRDWNRSGMGTTCTAAALIDKHLLLAQVGDSRGYLFRRRQLAQLTRDQSLVAQLIEAHQLTPEEAKAFEHSNIILQALGVSERVEVDISTAELRRGDVLLLCSDGLHGPVTEPTILHILEQEPVLENACDRLIEAARAAGGPDNITAVLVRFSGNALEEPAGETEGTQPAIPFLRLDLGQVDAYPLPPPLTRRPATQMEQIDKLPAAVREELVLARAARRSESARQAGGDGIPGCAAMSEGGSRQHLVATAAATAAVAAGQGWGVARETTDGIDQAGGGNGRPAGEFQAASEAGDGLSAAAAGALEQAAALDPEDLELRRPWSMGWLVLLVVVLAMLTGLSLTYLGRSPAPAATPRPAGHGPSASQASGGGR